MKLSRLGQTLFVLPLVAAILSMGSDHPGCGALLLPAASSEQSISGLRIVDHDLGERIAVAFDRPVVSPDRVGSAAPLNVDLPGQAVWSGVSTAVFHPSGTLPWSKWVKVSIKDVVAIDGTRLVEPAEWSFRTPGLRIVDDLPSETGTSPKFPLKFNRAVSGQELARHVRFRAGSDAWPARISGTSVESERTFDFGTRAALEIDGTLRADDGAELGDAFFHDFSICSKLGVESVQGSSDPRRPNEIEIAFSNPLVENTISSRLSVKPKADWVISSWGRHVTLTGNFVAGTSYWVQVAEGVTDTFGNRSDKAAATVQIPAYPPSLRFPERNSYVERCTKHAVPLESINVPVVHLSIRKLEARPWEKQQGSVILERDFEANHEPNEIFTHGIELPGAGVYRVLAEGPEVKVTAETEYQVTDLALTFKRGHERSLACVTSFSTALPVPDVDLTLFDEAGNEMWSGRSDAEGMAWIPDLRAFTLPPRFLVASTREDEAWLSLRGCEISTWRLPVDCRSVDEPLPLDLYLFTDRPLYRGGETVRFKGWCNGKAPESLQIQLRDCCDDIIDRRTCRPGKNEGFDSSFTLPLEAKAGTYSIVVLVGERTQQAKFEVGYYRAPSFEVLIHTPEGHLFPGDRFEASVEARTYFGAPLAGASAKWTATLEGHGISSRGRGELDSKGRMTIAWRLGKEAGPLSLEVEVIDAANQTIASQATVRVHASSLRIDSKIGQPFVETGKPLSLQWKVMTLDGTPVEHEVDARLIRRTWSSVQQLTAGRGWSYTWEKKDEIVDQEKVSTCAWTPTPQQPGPHILELRAVDDKGREAFESLEFDVVGPGEAGWCERNDRRVELIPDRELYRPGETARIFLRGNFTPSMALVTLEREGVWESHWKKVGADDLVLSLPIHDTYRPNVHVGVLLLTPRTGTELSPQGDDLGKPRFRFGYATLHVDTSDLRHAVNVKVPARCQVGAKAELDIVTTPGAEVTLAVVDQAVLALMGSADPDPHGHFMAERPLRVVTSEGRDDLASLHPLDIRGKKGRPGGGGGDKEGGRGRAIRKNFIGTAYWNPSLVAGEDGHVRVTVLLPDNLTRWRVIAVAAGSGRWGTGAATFETVKPLMIVSALPRFALLGDAFAARVVVHNQTGSSGRVRVNLNGSTQEIDIESGGSRPLDFGMSVETQDPLHVLVSADLGEYRDAIELTIPVHFPAATETAVVANRIDGRGELELPKMDKIDGVDLTLAPDETAFMEAQLRQLLEYPHGCVEQTTSKTLPLLSLRDLRIEGTTPLIEAGVKRLLSMQTPSGGLSYWPGGSEPHPAGTVYATHALVLASKAGIAVPAPALHRALNYVEKLLDESREHFRSYALYVLALAGRPREAYLESLPPDPYLALAAIEMGKLSRARQFMASRYEIGFAQVDHFESSTKLFAVTMIVMAKLGEAPSMDPAAFLESCRLTYERAWSLLALKELIRSRAVSASRSVRVLVDGHKVTELPLDGIVKLSVPFGRVRLESDGTVFCAARARGHRLEAASEDHGFWVRRSYTRSGEQQPRLDFKAGDLVEIKVTAWCPDNRHYIALEDPLPAGFEPVDLRFKTAIVNKRVTNDFDFLERRDDRIFASSKWLGSGLCELTYLARATTVGRFTAPAPRIEEMYAPDVYGRGDKVTVVVEAR